MPAISLDDIGSHAQPASVKKKKKATVKAKTTIKKAKTVSKGVKVKKKKKSDSSRDIMPTRIDADEMYADIAATQKALAEKEEKKAKKKKKKTNAVDTIKEAKKKKKVKSVPSTDLAVLEGELMEAFDAVPDVIKQENEQIAEYMTMFVQCQGMARICEENYRDKKQSRDIYALMQLYNQMREIIADLRALRDVSQLAEILNVEVMGPFAESAGTVLVGVNHQMKSWNKKNLAVEEIAKADAAVTQIIRNAAKDIEMAYQAGLNKTVEIFSSSA